jgi:hypothetical protein
VGGLLEAATGFLDRRLLTGVWLPVLVFTAALTSIVITGIGWQATGTWWDGLPADLRVIAVIVYVAATALIAQVLAARKARLVGFFEGYWDHLPLGRWLAACRRAHHLEVTTGDGITYPRGKARVMPTRLGNVLRAAEEHARRYNIDAVLTWPRLYVTLPAAFTDAFGAAAARLELMLTLSALGAAFAPAGGGAAVVFLPWWAGAACVGGGALVAWLAYRAAVRAALPYGNLIRTAFDVLRWLLLDTIGLDRPTSYAAELDQWDQLDKLWRRGAPDTGGAVLLGYPNPGPAQMSIRRRRRRPATPMAAPAPQALPTANPAGVGSPPQAKPLHLGRWLIPALGLAAGAAVGLSVWLDAPGRSLRPGAPTATTALPAWHVITPADLNKPDGDLVGHYTLRPVPKGGAVTRTLVGPAVGPLTGRVLTSVNVRSAAALHQGDVVTLYATPGETNPGRRDYVPGVLVLDVPAGGGTLVIAVPQAELPRLLAMGTTEIVPVRQPR